MNRLIVYISAIIFIMGCKLQSDTDQKYNQTKTYKLQVNPMPGSAYHYDITNETTMNLEVDGKRIENINKAAAGINYKISRDTINGLLFILQFDKIHLYSKNGDKIKEMDADYSELSSDPGIKLLKILRETLFQSTLNSNGEIKIISGFKEISDKIIAAFPATDPATRAALESQWNKTIGEQFVKQNTSQLFQRFPDTPIFVGSTWKYSTTQQGQLPVTVDNLFTVKSINSDITIIKCIGMITNTSEQTSISGIGDNVKASLKGEQQGEYEIETSTGMVISSHVKTNFEGTIQVMGREIPIRIKSSLKINGKKL